MNALVPIALYGWVPACLILFAILPKHRAVMAAFLIAWLFLPVVHEPVLGIRWTKMRATCYGLLLAALVYDAARLFAFSPKLWDLPVLAWCTCPFPSSMANGLGVYDGLSQSLEMTVVWGLPYILGRVYLVTPAALTELCVAVVVSGVVYSPLCLVEVQMSPQMHTWVYGYFPHSFAQTVRFGGYRPAVFMEHGLAVGTWLTSAGLIAFWLWWTGAVTKLPLVYGRVVPMGLVAGGLAVVTVLCKSSGAIGLGVVGWVVLMACRYVRALAPVLLLVLCSLFPAYCYSRGSGAWSGMDLGEAIADAFDRDRAASFIFRLDNENILIEKAVEAPVFGWGGWGRNRVFDREGKDITVTDGLWIIALGERGMYGLAALSATLLAPGLRGVAVFPIRVWANPRFAPAAVLTVVLVLYAVDSLLNAMVNPVMMLVAGGVMSINPDQLDGETTTAPGTAAQPPVERPRVVRKYFAELLPTGVPS